MLELTSATIRLHATAASSEDAIRQVGQLLADAGFIEPAYIESMLGREQQANTYLGNGIAIPHGLNEHRDLIRRTGIAVLQVPGGVAWKNGEQVRLLVGIAARSDEHLGLLANLVDVIADADVAALLASTDDPAVVIQHLGRRRAGAASPASAGAGDATAQVRMGSAHGLHARPAALFVQLASGFAADIQLAYGAHTANGKSLASLLRLGIPYDALFTISATGPDAHDAVAALQAAVESGLGEAPGSAAPAPDAAEQFRWQPASALRPLQGVAASPGLAVGPLYHYRAQRVVVRDAPAAPEQEHDALRQALAAAHAQLGQLHQDVRARAGDGDAAIFLAHQALLADPELAGQVGSLIDDGHSAAWSWQRAIEERVAAMQQLADERLAARAADLSDVGQRVLRLLVPAAQAGPQLPESPVILVAEDLLPSDTARLDPRLILGLCTALGGPTAHTAIIARSLGIPAVVGAGKALLDLPADAQAILDGGQGAIYLDPTPADVESARQAQAELSRLRDAEHATRYQPALTLDGERVEVAANIQRPSDAEVAVQAGAEGIGLMRTEFLFLERAAPPSEDEQYQAYAAMVAALNGLPLIIRTLDIGGDKAVAYFDLPAEQNPFLGVRGLRLCLQRPDIFRTQLRAIYRAALEGPVKIMFPMVATLDELRAAKAIAEQVRLDVGAPPVEIGIMVEVPSVVMMAEEFAREADFFSVGTNDLTQYAMAMDRLHPTLAKQVDALHPAVLRMIAQVVRAASAAGRPVGVCGGIAGEPRGAVILAGLGVAELSMSIPSIPTVKARLRGISMAQAQAVAQRALACATAEQVRQIPLAV
ncbi:phosphoenolpyruvate--protein phosphotransferase [Chloroflexia bacterium SDU3-3]|nr:phosphoenolpyruvate--protein phosphotransferase [Chloroflexia bacterium SDU3-3]